MASQRYFLPLVMFSTILIACGRVSAADIPLPKTCRCRDANMCRPLKEKKNTKYEVYAFGNGDTNIDKWKWETITAYMAPASFNILNKSQASTMCFTHQQGKKFGITVDMDLSGSLNSSSLEAQNWINSTISSQVSWNADIVNINLLPYFKSDHSSDEKDHIELVHIIQSVHKQLDKFHQRTGTTIEITCVVPWKPPCASTDTSCVFSSLITEACDLFVLSPDSFLDIEDEKCRASATIPFSKLVYGISEYIALSLYANHIILGVSWHGYDYTCSELENHVCSVKTVTVENTTTTKCDFSLRKRLTYNDIILNHRKEASEVEQNKLYNAPFFEYKDGSINHQVWFEDNYSLIGKYRLVKELSLAGMGIMYGDDLIPSKKFMSGEGLQWSWVAHEFILSKANADSHSDLHCADTVAGVAVGCLLLGCLLGVTFTCLTLHKRIRKPKKSFMRNADTGADDYTDEDPNL